MTDSTAATHGPGGDGGARDDVHHDDLLHEDDLHRDGGAHDHVGDDDVDDVEPGADPALARARRRLLAELLRPHRASLAVAAAMVVLSTFAVLAMPWLVRRGIDAGVVARDRGALVVALVLFAGAAVADYLAQRVALRLSGRISEATNYELRSRLWRHVQTLSLEFFERQKTGRIVSRATSDIEAVYELFSQAALTLVSNLLLLSGITVALFLLDPVLALLVMAFVLPALGGATWLFKRRSERAYRTVRERVALVIIHLAESLSGMRIVQAFSREPVNQAQFEDVNSKHRDANAETIFLMSVYGPGMEFLGQVAVVVVLLVGGYRAVDGLLTVGVLAAFILYLRQFFEPLQELSQFFNSFQAATAGLEKVAAVLREVPKVGEQPAAPALVADAGRIRFERVSFAYGEATVLHDVDLEIAAGETLALMGPTGAGKSTMAKLVARFYDPTAGRVLIDGQDLRSVSVASLRSEVAVVPQEPFLFGGSIHDNIALGRPDATRAEVEAAARAVGADRFVEALPEGYDTDVNKRGARLSGGQRQLLSFARAWLVHPRVLILDEATSALDLPSERLIQRALRTLLADRTAIVIAHRLTSIEVADRIAVVEGGRIVELGTSAELLASETRFAALHRLWTKTVA